jgi:alpha-galactosidase
VELLKQVRPYYYGDYYPLLPCSSNSDCDAGATKEHSAAFEWAAWQFNRPEQGDGMVQAFRREQSADSAKDLRLRGLDAGANYQVKNLDTEAPSTISGKDLMQKGLRIELTGQPGAAIFIYKRVPQS